MSGSVLAAALALCSALPAAGQAGRALLPEPMIVTSASKQFVVRGRPHRLPIGGADATTIYLDPSVLAVTCERVRAAMLRELKWDPRWRDTIFINIRPSNGRGEQATLNAIPDSTRGWRYRIDMPDELTRRELLTAIVEALLVEYSNRGARERSVELPPWLATGLTEHLMHGELAALPLQPVFIERSGITAFVPNSMVFRDRYRDDAGPELKARLMEGSLSVDQMNWPDHNPSDARAEAIYRNSTHLFVRELLRMERGPEYLAATLAILPEHMNWQTAFLRAFEAQFTRMLDVEKWWSLALVRTRMKETAVAWSAAESKARLEEILYTPMQVRLTLEDMPHVTPVSLGALMSEWSFAEQEPVLRGKIKQLVALRWRVPQEYATIAEEYRALIEGYVITRTSRRLTGKDNQSKGVQELLKASLMQLDLLDLRRSQVEKRSLTASIPATEQVTGRVP